MKNLLQLTDAQLDRVVADMRKIVSDNSQEIAGVAIAARTGNESAIARLAEINRSLSKSLEASIAKHQPGDA